jgi:hypothetical protein
MRQNITTGDVPFRKAYLRSFIDAVEVDDRMIRIHGSKSTLEQAVIASSQSGKNGVRSFVRKWRSLGKSEKPLISTGLPISTGQEQPLIHNGHFCDWQTPMVHA